MASIAKTVTHTSMQLGLGVVAGATMDALFPTPGVAKSAADGLEAAKLGAEVAVQLIANGLLTAVTIKALNTMAGGGFEDPTNGLTYMFALFESQPHLKEKIARMAQFIKHTVADETALIESQSAYLDGFRRGRKRAPVIPSDKTSAAVLQKPQRGK